MVDRHQTDALVDRRQKDRGELQEHLEFGSSTKCKFWLQWRRKWLLLTNKKETSTFLALSTVRWLCEADVAKALDLGHRGGLPSQAVTTLQEGIKELASAGESIGFLAASQWASTLIEETAMTIEKDSPITLHELHVLT